MPKATKSPKPPGRGRRLTHVDRAQIRYLIEAEFTEDDVENFFGCKWRAIGRAVRNDLKGPDEGEPEKDGELLEDAFLELVASRDREGLAAYIAASIEASDKGKKVAPLRRQRTSESGKTATSKDPKGKSRLWEASESDSDIEYIAPALSRRSATYHRFK